VKVLLDSVKIPFQIFIDVERKDCTVAKTLGDKATIVTSVVPKGNFTDHVITTKLTADEERSLRGNGLRLIKLGSERVWIRANSCIACKILSNSDALVINAKLVGQEHVIYNVIMPSLNSLRELIKELNSNGLKVTVVSKKKLINSNELTPRQLEVIILAYKRGLFDVDRKTSMKKLAGELGIKPSSFEEILRRALKKIIEKYLKENILIE
jgi:predicted DNA binding protein